MSGILVATSAPAPHLQDVTAYLLHSGWCLTNRSTRWATYARGVDGDALSIEVPLVTQAPDYPRAVETLLRDLERVESRPAAAILRDILRTTVDAVRLSLSGTATRDGTIDLEGGRLAHQAARDLLLAAACSAIAPRSVYSRRKPDDAMAFLRRARFGPSEYGSFVITLEAPLPPQLQEPSGAELWDAPFERKVTTTLAVAVAGSLSAMQEAAATGKLAPFQERTALGVSANLCEALADLMDAAQAEALSADFSFATARPVPDGTPRSVRLPADAVPVFRAAARAMKAQAEWPGTEVAGPVIKLSRETAGAGGRVVLHADVDGRTRPVRVDLGREDYQRAIEAHAKGRLVRAVGDLVQERAALVLRNLRQFVLEADVEGVD
jgi:hypothetical protein